MLILADGKTIITTDEEGYLLNLSDWSMEVAEKIANKNGITLTEEHWVIIHFLREFYKTYLITPTVRLLVKELAKKYGAEKGNSLYLHHLFPHSPLRLASKIAGLPKPSKCI